MISTMVWAGIMCHSTVPVFEAEAKTGQNTEKVVEIITPDSPKKEKTEKSRIPVGGILEAAEFDFTGEERKLPELEIEEDKINEFLEEKNGIETGRSCNYGYNTLNAKEKKVYDLLLKSMISFDVSKENAECVERTISGNYYAAQKVDVSSYKMTKSQMEKIYFALEADCLEFFWLDDTLCWEYSGNYIKSWYIMVERDYWTYLTRKAAAESIKKGMTYFLERIDNAKVAQKSEMEMELLIHDMIIKEVNYAYDDWGAPETSAYAHSIVGVFDNNSKTNVVCEGYAKAFQYLCNYAGLNSIYAVGYSTTGGYSGGHAWNLVKIDGKWYNVDLTWDDENENNEYDGYYYDYYNLPTRKFNANKEHDYRSDIFGGMYSVPDAVSTEATYFNYFNMNITASMVADDNALLPVLKKAIESSELREDNLLRFQCDSATTLKSLKGKMKDSVFCASLVNSLNRNGEVYAIDSVVDYSTHNQLVVSVSKIYVDNICNGYVFGSPKKEACVYQWQKRNKENITSQCDFTWEQVSSTEGTVSIKKGTQLIGNYEYTQVTPVIAGIPDQGYTGNGICPEIIVKVNGSLLQQNKDYAAEYTNNMAVGTAKVIIRGIGSYSGSTETKFNIVGKKVQNLDIFMEKEQYAYTGASHTPEIIVRDGAITLWEGVDYTLSYKNNTKMGTATVTIMGKGNYQGNKTLTFYIVPKKVSGVTLKEGNGTSLKFTYKKQTGVSGYEVSLYQGSKKVKVANTAKTAYQFKKLKKNTEYTFKVRAYVNGNGKKYGSYSNVLKVKTATKAPGNLSVASKSKSAVLKWKKAGGATGYEVYMSSKKSSGYKKIATVSKNKCTKKKLSPGKYYYFKVRSYTVKNKGKVYSEFSQVKKIKVK